MALVLIKGNRQKGVWQHDPDAYSDETIEFVNAAFRKAAEKHPGIKELVWNRRPSSKPRAV